MGVIAQELKKDMPNAVVEGPGKEGYKSLLYIDSNEILFSCVNAIKQLYSKIVANTNRINVLEEKLKQKDKQIENLEDQIREINKRLYTIQTKQK